MSANDYKRKLGLIGLGFAAWDLKLPSYAAIDGVEIVAAADPSPTARRRAQRELGIPAERCFASPYELLRSGLVDAVDVSTPHYTHADLLVAAAEAGVAAACDKPLAMSLAEADRIVAASERHGTPVGVFRNFAHFPSHRLMRDLVEQGAIGRPTFARVSAIGVYAPDTIGPYATSWRLRSEVAGGGIGIDYGIHAIYLARGLLGADIARVSAHLDRVEVQVGDVEDRISMRLETADGAYATVDLTWGGGSTGDVTVAGSEGVLKIVGDGGISAPHNIARAVGHLAGRRDETLHPLDWPREPFDWYYRGAIEEFLGQLDGTAGVTAADGRADLEVALAAYRSAALDGRPVPLPLEPDDPVYRRGVAGLHELELPADSVVLRKGLYTGGAV